MSMWGRGKDRIIKFLQHERHSTVQTVEQLGRGVDLLSRRGREKQRQITHERQSRLQISNFIRSMTMLNPDGSPLVDPNTGLPFRVVDMVSDSMQSELTDEIKADTAIQSADALAYWVHLFANTDNKAAKLANTAIQSYEQQELVAAEQELVEQFPNFGLTPYLDAAVLNSITLASYIMSGGAILAADFVARETLKQGIKLGAKQLAKRVYTNYFPQTGRVRGAINRVKLPEAISRDEWVTVIPEGENELRGQIRDFSKSVQRYLHADAKSRHPQFDPRISAQITQLTNDVINDGSGNLLEAFTKSMYARLPNLQFRRDNEDAAVYEYLMYWLNNHPETAPKPQTRQR